MARYRYRGVTAHLTRPGPEPSEWRAGVLLSRSEWQAQKARYGAGVTLPSGRTYRIPDAERITERRDAAGRYVATSETPKAAKRRERRRAAKARKLEAEAEAAAKAARRKRRPDRKAEAEAEAERLRAKAEAAARRAPTWSEWVAWAAREPGPPWLDPLGRPMSEAEWEAANEWLAAEMWKRERARTERQLAQSRSERLARVRAWLAEWSERAAVEGVAARPISPRRNADDTISAMLEMDTSHVVAEEDGPMSDPEAYYREISFMVLALSTEVPPAVPMPGRLWVSAIVIANHGFALPDDGGSGNFPDRYDRVGNVRIETHPQRAAEPIEEETERSAETRSTRRNPTYGIQQAILSLVGTAPEMRTGILANLIGRYRTRIAAVQIKLRWGKPWRRSEPGAGRVQDEETGLWRKKR